MLAWKQQLNIEYEPYTDPPAEIETSWAPYFRFSIRSWIDIIAMCKSQLEASRFTARDKAYLERDLKGYRQVLDSGKEQNAMRLITAKRIAKEQGHKFRDNLDVIQWMKSKGYWI